MSQEQLASELNVSRQVISKGEAVSFAPESEKLIAFSEYFSVSVDYLIKDEETKTPVQEQPTVKQETTTAPDKKVTIGLIVSIAGIVGLLLWGLVSIFNPSVFSPISESSMIHIDGNGLLLIGCLVAIIAGVFILLKGNK